jgi:BirA family biotin operon repressor/biotin-[acetyl-CoA-carboxylase] ligase
LSFPNTLFVGKVAYRHDRLDSTNAEALRLLTAKTRPVEGTAISASEQTAGRGQIGRSWYASPGLNLTTSVILYPKFLPADRQFRLNQAVSLAVADTVRDCLPHRAAAVRIKWPNDIYVADRKIAGILLQNGIQGRHLAYSVVGIGLNINEIDFPASLPNPTSLRREAGPVFDPVAVAPLLYTRLEQRYLQARRGEDEAAAAAYGQSLYRSGQPTYFRRADGSRFRGTIVHVDRQGRLLVDSALGREAFAMREISFEVAGAAGERNGEGRVE